MSTIYKYTEKNGQAWLTLSCYGAMAVDANQDWFETTSLSPYRRDWTSTDVFRGDNAYFGSNNSYILYGKGTLPFSLTAEQMAANTDFADAELMTLDMTENNGFDAEGGTLYLWFKTATAIEAGVPYLVKWEKAAGYDDNHSAYDVVNPVFEGVTISSSTAQTVESATNGLETVQMVGTFSPVSVAADDQSILFLGGANTLYYPSADLQICSCRVYFSVPYFKENAGAKVYAFELNFDGEEATGILEVSAEPNEKKDDAWYSLGGMRMNSKPTQRGMYINSSKKVVIK